MKNIYKSLFAALALIPLTSCVEEVFPTSGVTQDQLDASEKSYEAMVFAMPAYYNNVATVSGDVAYDWGYGSIMHIRDVMTDQFAVVSSGYDWYTAWEQNTYIGPGYLATQFIWNYYNKLVLTANNVLGSIDEDTDNEQLLYYRGLGYAFRASHYLDMARMYGYLPTAVTDPITSDGNDVTYYTVPIMTPELTEEQARKNYRASHEEMKEFLINDLTKAEELIQIEERVDKTLPDLSCVYGLFARVYMWDGGVQNDMGNDAESKASYQKAAEYARLAINNFSGTPTTRDEWLSTTNGFNNISTPSWMWGISQAKEDATVQTWIINWTSWNSNETYFGYTSYGPFTMISASTYNRMSDDDFRKLSYKAPTNSSLYNQVPVIDSSWAAYLPTYTSYKFRPADGNMDDPAKGAASSYPLMRVEEMYFIEAEASEHATPGSGKALLEDFMKRYRYSSYKCTATDVVEEIYFQKAVELWGEGQTYFDMKRLNYSARRSYTGTNFAPLAAFNTNGRPAWMNICIVATEGNNNEGLRGWNNPDPSDLYEPAN